MKSLLTLCIVFLAFGFLSDARNLSRGKEQVNSEKTSRNSPPPVDQHASMARYIVNQADWTAVATISSRNEINKLPYIGVISCSDGEIGAGSGVPYMFLTPLDYTAQDLEKDPRATLLMTLAQGDYCKEKDYDPMDPRCARVTLTGLIREVKNDSAEIEVAKKAVFGRHPWLAHMLPDHHFFFAKLKMQTITLFDTFGGTTDVPVQEYFNPPNPTVTRLIDARYRRSRSTHDARINGFHWG